MKSYKLTIVIFAISSFVAAGVGLGQEASREESVEALRQAERQLQQTEKQLQQTQKQLKDAIATKVKAKKGRKPYSLSMPFSGKCRDVLVIPSSEIDAEKLGEITEDMAVMSRILEKQVREHSEHHKVFFYGASWLGQDYRSIFLDGYGALFLTKVGFPLLPVQEAQVQEAEKEEVDPVWEQTKRELHSPGMMGIVIPHPMPFGGEETQKYDKEKVEALKSNLIETLKYAANIRALKSDEFAVVVVTGAGRNGSGPVNQNIVVSSAGNTIVNQTAPGQTQDSSPGVLTIQAKKSDIDSYSKGELDFDQFSQKVSMFIY